MATRVHQIQVGPAAKISTGASRSNFDAPTRAPPHIKLRVHDGWQHVSCRRVDQRVHRQRLDVERRSDKTAGAKKQANFVEPRGPTEVMNNDPIAVRAQTARSVSGGRWRIRLLGEFSARDGERSLDRLPPTERRLLAKLALAGHEQPLQRADVAAEFWPKAVLEDGLKLLSSTLSKLREALLIGGASPLTITGTTIALRTESIDIDVVDFLALVRTGQEFAARRLYCGPLLPKEQAPWLIAQRARLDELFQTLSDTSVMPAMLPPARRQMPVYRDYFVGRDKDVSRLLDAAGDHRLVTVVGAGGTGKTRLAVEASRRLEHHNLILFVPFEASTRGDSVLDGIRAARDLQARPRGLWRQLIADLQTYTSPLLLLDNLEQHVGTSHLKLLSRLMDGVPALRVWATSRQPLGLSNEHVVRLLPLQLPTVDSTIECAEQAPAVALFCSRARAHKKTFHLHSGNVAAVVELCRRLDGLPLAIEIAAARIGVRLPARILLEIVARQPLRRDGRASRAVVQRHVSLDRAIEWSWDLLPRELQHALSAFAVFRGGCTLEHAAQIAGLTPRAARLALSKLCDHSLMQPPALGASRYGIDQTIAEFVRARTAAPLKRTFGHRYREVFTDLALDAARTRRAVPSDDVPDAMHALAMTAAENPGEGAVLALALRTHWRASGVTPKALSALQHLSRQLPPDHPHAPGFLCLVALLLVECGEGQHARKVADRALELAGDDVRRRAEALVAWINVRSRVEPDPQRLDAQCREALALARDAGDALLLARVLLQWGPVKIAAGDVAGARADFCRATLESECADDEEAALTAIAGELACDLMEQRYAEMEERAVKACERAQLLGHVGLQLLMLNRLGGCTEGLGDPKRAFEIYLHQAALAHAAGLEYHFAYAIWNQCLPMAKRGQVEDAACLMAFSVRYWRSRFGRLSRRDTDFIESVRLAATEHCTMPVWRRHWTRGGTISWAAGIALGLGRAPPTT